MLNRYYLLLVLVILSCSPFLFSSCEDESPKAPVMVSGFEPTSGDYGSEIIINGSNFSADVSRNEVYVGSVKATIVSATPTQLIFSIPPGSSSGKIVIKANGQETSTDSDLTVTCGNWSLNGKIESIKIVSPAISFVINGLLYVHQIQDASFRSYDPATGVSTALKELSVDINDGYVNVAWASATKGYVFTGDHELWEYDPSLNNWTKKTAPDIPYYYDMMFAFYLSETDQAYMFDIANRAWVYSVSDNTWARLPDTPFLAEVGTISYSVTSSKAYIVDSHTLGFWVFDPVTSSWNQLGLYPGRRPNFSFILNNDVYVGSSSRNRYPIEDGLWKFDASKNDWIQKASLSVAREGPIYFNIGQKGFIGMGMESNAVFNDFSYEIFQYNP